MSVKGRKTDGVPGNDFLFVAAIDFGTAYSGYAYSSRDEYKKDALKVSAHTWGAGNFMSQKTSTCVLFDKNKKFVSFGFEAEDKYSDLAYDNEHHDYYFFRKFKMMLFDRMHLKRKFMLEDELGKKMGAMDVFSACIKYLRDHLMEKCRSQYLDVLDSDIRWVLTVPAIWNDSSKQFMREAAAKAGIKEEHLIIALEPEAASLCCRHVRMNTTQKSSGELSQFPPGSKYLVFDAGGGTVDITVHQVQWDDTVKELYKANGGNWGGTYVDKAFRDLLADIVGNDVMDNFQATKMMDYISLLREFEVKKRSFKNDMTGKINLTIPFAIHEDFRKARGKDIKDHIQNKPQYNGRINWMADKLRIEAEVAKGLFKDACDSVARHLKSLFERQELSGVDVILMVGGFSESPLLQDVIRQTLPDKKIVIPQDPGLAVLKGAVIYGHNPALIKERRCRYTYGVKTCIPFQDGVHQMSKRFIDDDGDVLCEDIFDRHVKIGQPVVFGESQVTQSYLPTSRDTTQMLISFFASEEEEPLYVTDKCCQLIGQLKVDITRSGSDRAVNVTMTFSGTELEVTAVAKRTGAKANARFDFLG